MPYGNPALDAEMLSVTATTDSPCCRNAQISGFLSENSNADICAAGSSPTSTECGQHIVSCNRSGFRTPTSFTG